MFDALKNLGHLGEMMRKAGQMQGKMREVQENLARQQVSADAGGGIVTAIVNGKLELVKISIDKSRANLADVEMLEDLITAAVSAAQVKAADMAREEMAKMASDMGLPPGMLP